MVLQACGLEQHTLPFHSWCLTAPTESCIVGGYTVPKGARVFVNVWVVHRDPSVWKNPLEFDPEQFLGNSKWDYSGNDFNYFPFGSGRRICAATAMAKRMFMFSLASLMHSFDWKLPEGEKLDLEEKFGIVLKKKAKSKIFRAMRKKQTLLHTMSRKGYARGRKEGRKENPELYISEHGDNFSYFFLKVTQIDYKVINMDRWIGFYRFCNEFPCYSNVERRHGASPSVIVIGGGFASMAAAQALHDASF
ncbi:unnamed protein product [Camellia sinensis]